MINPPAAPALSSVAGGTLAAATYNVVITYVGSVGETTPSPQASLAVAVNNLLRVASPAATTGATGYNVYAGTGASLTQQASGIAIGTSWTEPTTGLVAGSAPPTGNSTALVLVTDLREHTEDNDPGSANLSLKGGKAKMSYWLKSTNVEDFSAAATLILGSAQPAGNGGITRQLPMAHPRFPTLYAESLPDFPGLGGGFVKEGSAATVWGAPPPPQYARYPQYRIDVEFANRLYTLGPDLTPPGVATWMDDQGTGADVQVKYWDAAEYTRWVWTTSGPKENFITGKTGQLGYIDIGNPFVSYQFSDFIRVPMPDGAVKLTWYEVPYSFVTSANSFFRKYQGRINYQSFLGWPAGSLLYVTIQARPYMQPIPLVPPGGGAARPVALCDIDVIMMETSRTIAPGDAAQPAPAPGGRLTNWVVGGWNLQLWWRDRQFHYCHQGKSTDPLSSQIPLFRSVPLQLLFSDPDTPPPP